VPLFDDAIGDLRRELWLAWDGADRAVLGLPDQRLLLPAEAGDLFVVVLAYAGPDENAPFVVIDLFRIELEGMLRPLRLPGPCCRVAASLAAIHSPPPSQGFDFRIEPVVSFTLDPALDPSGSARLAYGTGTPSAPDLLGVDVVSAPERLDRDALEAFLRHADRREVPLAFAIAMPTRPTDTADAAKAMSFGVGPCTTIHPTDTALVGVAQLPFGPEVARSALTTYAYAVWSHSPTITPRVSLAVTVPVGQDDAATSLSSFYAVHVLMQRKLDAWWGKQLEEAGRAGASHDRLVHVTFENVAQLDVNVANHLDPVPFEPDETIVAVPLDGTSDRVAIEIGRAEVIDRGGTLQRYRIDFQLASCGDYIAVVDRYRARLGAPDGTPCRIRAFQVARGALVAVALPADLEREIFARLVVADTTRGARRQGATSRERQGWRGRDPIRAVVDEPVAALTSLAYQRLCAELVRRGRSPPPLDSYEEDPPATTAAATSEILARIIADPGRRAVPEPDAPTFAEEARGFAEAFAEEPRFIGRILAEAGLPRLVAQIEPASLALELGLYRICCGHDDARPLETLVSACAEYRLPGDTTFPALLELADRVEAFARALENEDIRLEIDADATAARSLSVYLAMRERGALCGAEDFLDLLGKVEAASASVERQHVAADSDRASRAVLTQGKSPPHAPDRAALLASLEALLAEATKSSDPAVVAIAWNARGRLERGKDTGIVYLTTMIADLESRLGRDDKLRELAAFCAALCDWAGFAPTGSRLAPEMLLKLFEEARKDLDRSLRRRGDGREPQPETGLAGAIARAEGVALEAFARSFPGGSSAGIHADVRSALPRLVHALALHWAHNALETLRRDRAATSAPPPDLARRMRLWPLDAEHTWERHEDWAGTLPGPRPMPVLPDLAAALAPLADPTATRALGGRLSG
jgi:hypothetical protein